MGAFATTEFAESRIDVKMRLALNPQWKNALYVEEKIVVPKDVVINVGVVAPVKLFLALFLKVVQTKYYYHLVGQKNG